MRTTSVRCDARGEEQPHGHADGATARGVPDEVPGGTQDPSWPTCVATARSALWLSRYKASATPRQHVKPHNPVSTVRGQGQRS